MVHIEDSKEIICTTTENGNTYRYRDMHVDIDVYVYMYRILTNGYINVHTHIRLSYITLKYSVK